MRLCFFFNTKHYKPAPKSPPNKTRLVGYRLNIHGANSYTMNGNAHSLLQFGGGGKISRIRLRIEKQGF